MAATSPYNCAAYVAFDTEACAEDEAGRIQHAAFIEESEVPVNPLDITSSFILTQEAAGKAIVFREVSGAYDGGVPTKGPGFGSQQERTTGKVHTAVVKVPQIVGNELAAQALEKRAALYRPVWLTGSRLWVAPKGAQVDITAQNPITDNTTDTVTPTITVVFNKNAVVPSFAGFDVAGLLSGTATVGAGGTLPLPAQQGYTSV